MDSVRKSVLERLIAQTLISQTAADMNLRVGDAEIINTIRDMKEFQVDGQFDNNRYLSLVRSAGYRVEQFRELLRVDLTRTQLMNGVVGSNFVLKNEAQRITILEQQLRDIRYIEVNAADFVKDIVITEQEINDYYDLNSGQFTTQEQLSLEYVELKVADLLAKVVVEDKQIQDQYNVSLTQYQTQERRRVSHILLEFGEDEAAAQAKAQAALLRVNAGEDFAVLAKELSDDTFSGEDGGDLEWITNDVADDAFNTAAFAIDNGASTGLVRTDSGFHIIKVTDLEASTTKSLDDVRGEIQQELLTEAAKELFYELQQQLADTAFSVPENLIESATVVESTVKSTALFTRSTVPTSVNFPGIIEAAFSEQVLGENVNSDVIEITPDHHIVIRKKEHMPSQVKAITDVTAQITATLKQQKAADLAEEKAQQYLASWTNAEVIDGVAIVEKKDVLRTTRDIDVAIVTAAFKMAKGDSNDIELVATAKGQAIVDLVSVKEASDTAKEIDAVIQRLTSTSSNANYKSFIQSLKDKSDIQYPAS
jgi:peptidyl-prolyl cis-trans isomerase D